MVTTSGTLCVTPDDEAVAEIRIVVDCGVGFVDELPPPQPVSDPIIPTRKSSARPCA